MPTPDKAVPSPLRDDSVEDVESGLARNNENVDERCVTRHASVAVVQDRLETGVARSNGHRADGSRPLAHSQSYGGPSSSSTSNSSRKSKAGGGLTSQASFQEEQGGRRTDVAGEFPRG